MTVDRDTPMGAGDITTPHGRVRMEGTREALQWVVENMPGVARRWSLFRLPRGINEPCEDCDAYGCTMNCSPATPAPRVQAPPTKAKQKK